MSALLAIEKLALAYGQSQVLFGLDLSIGEGEVVTLLGRNGMGKSSTVRAICGLSPAPQGIRGGEIRFAGEPVAGGSPDCIARSGIALVPEGRRLFPGMTVQENLAMGAYAAASRRALDEPLEQVFGLFPILRQKARQNAGELSGGQQQMVAIGRALMSRPRLLLLDEPFIGVAPLLVDEILAALRRIAEQGVTMLLVEQNTHRALDFVDRAYVLENGRTVLEGSREALLGDPAFAAKFLGLE